MKFVRRSATIYKQTHTRTHTHNDRQEQAQIFTLADVDGHKSCFVCGDAIATKLRSRCHPQCPHSLPLTMSLRKLRHILNTCKQFIWHNAYRYIDMRKHTFIYDSVCVCVYLLHSLSRFSLFFMNETFVVCIIGALCLAVTHRYYTYAYVYVHI